MAMNPIKALLHQAVPTAGKAADPGTAEGFARVMNSASAQRGDAGPAGLKLLTPPVAGAGAAQGGKAARSQADTALLSVLRAADLTAGPASETPAPAARHGDGKTATRSAPADKKSADKGDASDKKDVPVSPLAALVNAAADPAPGGAAATTTADKAAPAVAAAGVIDSDVSRRSAKGAGDRIAADGHQGPSRHQAHQSLHQDQSLAAATARPAPAPRAAGAHGDGPVPTFVAAIAGQTGADAGASAGQALAAAGGAAPASPSPAAAASTPTHATPTSIAGQLSAPVGSAPWQQQLGQQLVHMSQRGDQQVQLHLHPRDLGPLQVSLRVDDQGAQAHFFAAHAQVRGAVEQAIPQLREALANQGIALGEAMVGQQQQQQGRQWEGFEDRAPAPLSGPLESVEEVRPAGAVTTSVPLSPGSGVDLYA